MGEKIYKILIAAPTEFNRVEILKKIIGTENVHLIIEKDNFEEIREILWQDRVRKKKLNK